MDEILRSIFREQWMVILVVGLLLLALAEAGFRTGMDYINSLSSKVEGIIKGSIEKVKAAGNKKTLGSEDL